MNTTRKTIIDNLVTALKAIKTDDDYQIQPAMVSPVVKNIQNISKSNCPAILVIDGGEVEKVVEDDTNVRWKTEIFLVGIVKSDTEDDIHNDLNDMNATLTKFCFSDPDLGSYALEYKFVSADGHNYELVNKPYTGVTTYRTSITYYEPKASM